MKLNKLALIVVTGLSLSGLSATALADDKWLGNSGSNWLEHVQSTKTRAQVLEELKQARAQGLVRIGEDPTYPQAQIEATERQAVKRTRAEVRAEAARAAQSGLNGMNSNHYLGG